jgi:small subunit ribosomal protein S4
MSRYLGPRVRVMRAFGMDIPGLSRKSIERRPYPPGEHGGKRRRRESEYALRLREKQKLRFYYGLTERQFRNLFRRAARSTTNTGERLLEFLERRLDNVVFRAGFARTIPAARQFVGHGHIWVDGRRVDCPGFRVRPGQVIAVAPRSRDLDILAASLLDPVGPPPSWLDVDAGSRSARIRALPGADSTLVPIDIRLVIEFYAARD